MLYKNFKKNITKKSFKKNFFFLCPLKIVTLKIRDTNFLRSINESSHFNILSLIGQYAQKPASNANI